MAIGINWKKLFSEFNGKAQSVGVCLGPSRLTLAHIRKEFRRLDLAHLISWEFSETGLTELEVKVGEAVSGLELAGLPVALTIDHGPWFIKQIRLPKAAVENLAQVVSYELDRFIPVAPEQVWFNFQVDKKTDTEIHLILFAVHKKPVKECLEVLAATGLKPISVELAPMSCANAFTFFGKRLPVSWLLLDMAEGVTDLYQIDKGRLRHNLRKVYFSKDEMWPEIKEVIENIYEKNNSEATLCLTGEAVLSEEVKESYQFDQVTILHDAGILAEKFSLDLPATPGIWPALGAALHGLVKVPMVCNLLPAEDRCIIPLSNPFLTRLLIASLVSLFIIWAGSFYFHKRIALYRVDQKIKNLSASIDQAKQQRAEIQAISHQLQDLWGGKNPALCKLKILTLLTRTIPDHTWIYSLRLNPKQLEISGMSKSAADLIQLLDKSGLFAKTQFSSPIVNDASGNENFTIQAELKQLD